MDLGVIIAGKMAISTTNMGSGINASPFGATFAGFARFNNN